MLEIHRRYTRTRKKLHDWSVKPPPSRNGKVVKKTLWANGVYSDWYKRQGRESKRLFLGLGTTSRLTVPDRTATRLTEIQAKRCVGHLKHWTSDNPQPPGPLHPAYGTPPTANGWYFLFALPKADNYCSPRQQRSQSELSPQGLGKAESLIPRGFLAGFVSQNAQIKSVSTLLWWKQWTTAWKKKTTCAWYMRSEKAKIFTSAWSDPGLQCSPIELQLKVDIVKYMDV